MSPPSRNAVLYMSSSSLPNQFQLRATRHRQLTHMCSDVANVPNLVSERAIAVSARQGTVDIIINNVSAPFVFLVVALAQGP